MLEEGYVVSKATLEKLGDGCPVAGRRILRCMIDLEIEHEPINGPTEKPRNVRAAVEADEENILALVREDIEENARHIAPLDEDKVMSMVRGATRAGNGAVGVIDAPDGTLAGMICLTPGIWWWSTQWANTENFCFVSKTYRKSNYAVDLIKFSRWHTDQLSAKLGYQVYLLSGVTATQEIYGKAAMYRRHSNLVGAFFAYPYP